MNLVKKRTMEIFEPWYWPCQRHSITKSVFSIRFLGEYFDNDAVSIVWRLTPPSTATRIDNWLVDGVEQVEIVFVFGSRGVSVIFPVRHVGAQLVVLHVLPKGSSNEEERYILKSHLTFLWQESADKCGCIFQRASGIVRMLATLILSPLYNFDIFCNSLNYFLL